MYRHSLKAIFFGLKTVFSVSYINSDVTNALRFSINFMINWRGKEQSRNHLCICERKKIPECVELCKLRDQGRTLGMSIFRDWKDSAKNCWKLLVYLNILMGVH